MRKNTTEALHGELAALRLSLYWVVEPKARGKVICRMQTVTQILRKRGVAV
jgi:hypothetical protein